MTETSAARNGVPALTPTGAAVLGMWRAALGRDRIGPDDEFVSLGGDSLCAIALVAAASEAFAVDLSVREVFEDGGTVRAMASLVERARREGREQLPSPDLAAVDAAALAEASLAQEREWFVAALAPDAPVGNVTLALRLRGALQPERLERALSEVVARHDLLRARFVPVHGRVEVQLSSSPDVELVRHEPAD